MIINHNWLFYVFTNGTFGFFTLFIINKWLDVTTSPRNHVSTPTPIVGCWVAGWMGWPEEARGAMWIRGDLFKLIVGVRWMIGRSYIVILTNDGDARLASTFVLCTLFAAIWDAVTGSSLIRGCRTFLACHEQSEQTTQQLSSGVTGTTNARFASYFLIIILPAYHHHHDSYAESECKYSSFRFSIC